jgi:hypothetical protein
MIPAQWDAATTEDVQMCEYCEDAPAETLVRSEDPSTGYREEMNVCHACKAQLGRRDA